VEVKLHAFLNLELDGDEWRASDSDSFTGSNELPAFIDEVGWET
jgi:hypothetical protein